MINLNEFVALKDFSQVSDEELQEIVRNFENKLCLGAAIDNNVIVAADLAKSELERRK
jgi:hypothetical protein